MTIRVQCGKVRGKLPIRVKKTMWNRIKWWVLTRLLPERAEWY